MLSRMGALLEDHATGRGDRHTETVQTADVTRFVDGIDRGVRTSNIDGDLCVRRDAGPLQLKQETSHSGGALDCGRILPDRLAAVSFQRPSCRRGENTPG